MAKGDDIEERLVDFAVDVIALELNESRVWLKIITRSGILPAERMSGINQECDQLCRIINASIKTTKSRNQ